MNDLNPHILVSIINTKLRDFYKSLDELCSDLDISKDDLTKKLEAIDYIYSKEENQFKRI